MITALFITATFQSLFFFSRDEMRSEIAARLAAQAAEQETPPPSDDEKTTKESHQTNAEFKQTRQTREMLPYPIDDE